MALCNFEYSPASSLIPCNNLLCIFFISSILISNAQFCNDTTYITGVGECGGIELNHSDYLFNEKFIIDDTYNNGDFVGRVHLYRGKSDGSEVFTVIDGDKSLFDVNPKTGVITVADANLLIPATYQLTILGTLIKHINQQCVINIEVYELGTEYYVTTNGDNTNDGLSEATAWATVDFADSKMIAGDKCWIKAGTYTELDITLGSGSEGKYKMFEGYMTTTGDVPEYNFKYGGQYGDQLDPTKMPLFDGGDRTANSCIKFGNHQYLRLKNIQIKNYKRGINSANNVQHIELDNILGANFGSITESGDGMFIIIYGVNNDNNIIRNIYALNSAQVNFGIYGSYNWINNVNSYCNSGPTHTEATDYYITIRGEYNTLINSYAERAGNYPHTGHGINMKGTGVDEYTRYNLIKYCEIVNIGKPYQMRWEWSSYNIIEDCIAREGVSGTNSGFTARDGAHHNTFRRCKSIGGARGTNTWDSVEPPPYPTKNNPFAHDNRWEYCVFLDNDIAISANYDESFNSVTLNETYYNCVFDGQTYLFGGDADMTNVIITNCVITNVANVSDGAATHNVTYTNDIFYNNGFTPPTGHNILSADPLFIDAENHDYALQENSPCINAGIDVGLTTDFNKNTIQELPDMGILEYKFDYVIDLTMPNYIDSLIISDNCELKDVIQIPIEGSDITEMHTEVSVIAMDQSNNTTTCDFVVTALYTGTDTIPPVIISIMKLK